MLVIKGIESILLSSENATKLAAFYKDMVGLKQTDEGEMGEDGETKLYGFGIGSGSSFYIVDHSDVQGKNPDPHRVMVNFEVDDIEKEAARLKEVGVKEIGQLHHVENYGLIATFEDPEGNYFQLVQVRE